MAGEANAGFGDHALLHRRRHERLRGARAAERGAAAQHVENVRGVRDVEPACNGLGAQRDRQDLQAADEMRADVRDGVAIAQVHAQPDLARSLREEAVIPEHG